MLPQRFARFNIYYRQQGNRLRKIQQNIHLFASNILILETNQDLAQRLKEEFQ